MINIIKEIIPFNNKYSNNKIIYIIKVLLKIFLLYVVSILIAEAIVIGLHYPLGYNPFGKPMPGEWMLLFKFYGYIVFLLLFILFIKKLGKIKLSDVGLNKNFKSFFKGIICSILSLGVIIGLLVLFGLVKFKGINTNINYLMIILFMGGFLIQSAMEEVICRGFIFHKLKDKVSMLVAVTISVLYFSLGHFTSLFNDGLIVGIVGVINLILISFIWVLFVLRDRNIYGAIGYHFIWNFLLFNIIGLNLSGIDKGESILQFTASNSILVGKSYGIESSIITTLVLIIFMIFMLKFKKNK